MASESAFFATILLLQSSHNQRFFYLATVPSSSASVLACLAPMIVRSGLIYCWKAFGDVCSEDGLAANHDNIRKDNTHSLITAEVTWAL